VSYAVLGGGREAARDRASAEVRAARAELELTLRRIDDAIDRTFSAFATARSRVNALTAAVAQSEEIVRIEKLSLREGAGVQSDYLLAEAELFRARAGLTEANTQLLLSIVEVGRLSGALSPEWIATNVEPGQ
jgi:outer membrane protein TolC